MESGGNRIVAIEVPLPFIFLHYIKSTAKSLKAMGFVTKKIIILPRCTTIDRVKKDKKMPDKLIRLGRAVK